MFQKGMRPVKKSSKAGSTKRARKPIPTWVAPEDFKAFAMDALVRTEKDGLLGSKIKCTRYRGTWDPKCDPKKKFAMNEYDPDTCQGILARLSMVTFITNQDKRLPKNTMFRIVLRVSNRKAKGNIIGVTFRRIDEITKVGTKLKVKQLDKKDPIYRRFRRAARILPCAFKAVQMPPKPVRKSRVAEE